MVVNNTRIPRERHGPSGATPATRRWRLQEAGLVDSERPIEAPRGSAWRERDAPREQRRAVLSVRSDFDRRADERAVEGLDLDLDSGSAGWGERDGGDTHGFLGLRQDERERAAAAGRSVQGREGFAGPPPMHETVDARHHPDVGDEAHPPVMNIAGCAAEHLRKRPDESRPSYGRVVVRDVVTARAERSLRAWLALLPTWAPKNPNGLAFPTKRGAHHRTPPRGWRAWLSEAGLSGRGLTWHSLRHTCATLSLNGELDGTPWDLSAVQSLLGHADQRTTQNYAILLNLPQLAAVRRGAARDRLPEPPATPPGAAPAPPPAE